MSEYYLIANPVSGSGKGRRLTEQVRAELGRRGIEYGFAWTEGKGHAAELARRALESGAERILCAGGDGTVREVAGVLIGSRAAMGMLPFGTGNDFAHCLKLPTEPMAALEAALNGRPTPVDAADANGECFMNVAGTGFDVDVIRYTEKFKRRFNGMLPYLLGVFQAMLRLRPQLYTITADGHAFAQRALLVSACNGVRFAGGMNVAPEASPFDGLLDVCILDDLGIIPLLTLMPRYIAGKHLDSPHIRYFKARELRVEGERANTLNLDGELESSTPAVFKALPGAVRVLLPGEAT